MVDFTISGARIEQDVPFEELERAMHLKLVEAGESAANAVLRRESVLRTYALEHLHATSAAGNAPWQVEVLDITGHSADDGPRARFRFALRAPAGEAAQ